jgi:hypothetical protein
MVVEVASAAIHALLLVDHADSAAGPLLIVDVVAAIAVEINRQKETELCFEG